MIFSVRIPFVPVLAVVAMVFLSGGLQASKFDELSAESRKSTLLDQVIRALNDKEFPRAIALLDEADKLSPGDPLLRNARAATLIQMDRYDEARVILSELVAENPEFFQADYNLGEILFLQGDYDGAQRHFRRMSDAYNGPALLRFKVLLCQILTNERTDAGITLRTFRFPSDGAAWYFANAAMKASDGDPAAARKLAATARTIHGDSASLFEETLQDSKLLP